MAGTKTLDDAIRDNAEDFKKKMIRAAKRATKEAMREINNNALSCLQEYYNEYDPTSYRRTDSLRHAIFPTYFVVEDGNDMLCEAGIEFDSTLLDAYVAGEPAYDASNKYVIVDTDWVIVNFLNGVHPRTNGASIPDEVEYMPKTFLPSPNEKLQNHIDTYRDKFNSALYKYFHL